MRTTIIDAVRSFLLTCPLLADGKLNVDFLPEEAAGWSVDVTPVAPVVKRYLGGSTRRQFAFLVATRTYYGDFVRQQLDNLAVFEALTEWLEAQNAAGTLPDLGEGRKALGLEVTTSGYVFAPGTETARYQIQCRLEYWQTGSRRGTATYKEVQS